jgi:carbonic anhydrase
MGDGWMTPIRTLHKQHRRQIDEIVSEDAQIQTLCELNVRLQVKAIAELPLVESRLAVGSLKIDGVVWSSRDGLLRDPGTASVRAAKVGKGGRRETLSVRLQGGALRDQRAV